MTETSGSVEEDREKYKNLIREGDFETTKDMMEEISNHAVEQATGLPTYKILVANLESIENDEIRIGLQEMMKPSLQHRASIAVKAAVKEAKPEGHEPDSPYNIVLRWVREAHKSKIRQLHIDKMDDINEIRMANKSYARVARLAAARCDRCLTVNWLSIFSWGANS